MPTIHIHIPNNDQAMSLIAMLLNESFHVTVDLDEMTETNPESPTSSIEASAARLAKQAWRDEQRARKTHTNNIRKATAIAASDVECRSCGAKVGAQCVTPQGKPHPAYAHMTRIRDHHTAAGR